jgi:hypothetical protein
VRAPTLISLTAFGALSAAAVAFARGERPPPPPDWSAHLTRPTLRPGGVVTYEYRAVSSDAFDLRVSLHELPPQLTLVKGMPPHRLIGGRPTWSFEFPGGRAGEVARGFKLKLRVDGATDVGSKVCVRLRQVASNGGVPDVVPLVVCGVVRAPGRE